MDVSHPDRWHYHRRYRRRDARGTAGQQVVARAMTCDARGATGQQSKVRAMTCDARGAAGQQLIVRTVTYDAGDTAGQQMKARAATVMVLVCKSERPERVNQFCYSLRARHIDVLFILPIR